MPLQQSPEHLPDPAPASGRRKSFPWTSVVSLTFFVLCVYGLCRKPVDSPGAAPAAQQTRSTGDYAVSPGSKPAPGQADTAGAYTMKDVVKIGNFVYFANGAGYNKSVGDRDHEIKADGLYLVLLISYANNSSVMQALDNADFTLTDRQGNEYQYSVEGSAALEQSSVRTIYNKQCSPKVVKQGYLCFEVPGKATYYLHLPGQDGLPATACVRIPKKLH